MKLLPKEAWEDNPSALQKLAIICSNRMAEVADYGARKADFMGETNTTARQ